MKRTILSHFTTLLLVVGFLTLSTCARNPVTGKQEIMLVSEDQEIAMGNQYHPQVLSQFGVYPDSTLQRFIRQKGNEMAEISHRPNLPWTFTIVDSPVVNAFAVPGGYVYFTRGIMAHFNNEAQFAGVLGHEIGHVTARHSASQQSKQTLAQVGLVAGMVISPELAQLGEVAGQGLQILFMKFSRDDESQSDRLGVEYSTRIGYNAHQMADFFNTLERLGGGNGIPTFLSTHPDPVDRFNTVHKLAEDWQTKLKVDPGQLKVNRDSYLQMIDGIVYGDDPRQGFFESGFFYHPELRFKFPTPAGWKTQNAPSQVIMIPEDQGAALVLQIGQGNSPQEAAQKAAQGFNLNVVEAKETTVNGLPAYYVIGDASDQQSGQTFRVLVYEIKYGDLVYQFVGYSSQQNFNNYSNTFLNSIRGFNRLTDQSKINVQPWRIDVETLPRDMNFSEAMRYFNQPSDRIQELAVLNGMEMEQNLRQGVQVKTITK